MTSDLIVFGAFGGKTASDSTAVGADWRCGRPGTAFGMIKWRLEGPGTTVLGRRGRLKAPEDSEKAPKSIPERLKDRFGRQLRSKSATEAVVDSSFVNFY